MTELAELLKQSQELNDSIQDSLNQIHVAVFATLEVLDKDKLRTEIQEITE